MMLFLNRIAQSICHLRRIEVRVQWYAEYNLSFTMVESVPARIRYLTAFNLRKANT